MRIPGLIADPPSAEAAGKRVFKTERIRVRRKQFIGMESGIVDQVSALRREAAEIRKQLRLAADAPTVVVLDVRHNAEIRMHERVGPIRFIHFRHEKVIPLSGRSRRGALHRRPDQKPRPAPDMDEDMGQHRGNAGLAVGTGDGDRPPVLRREPGQKFAAADLRDAERRRAHPLRILRRHRRRVDQKPRIGAAGSRRNVLPGQSRRVPQAARSSRSTPGPNR